MGDLGVDFERAEAYLRPPSVRGAVRILVRTCIALGTLASARAASAQPRPGSPLCVPGSQICASADGRGNVHIDASGRGQVTPNGANASGQANANAQVNAQGQANANANSRANASANTQASTNAQANTNANANVQANTNANVRTNASTSARGNATGNGNGRVTEGGTPSYFGGESPHYQGYTGRFGVGVTGCPIVRAGIWSGFKVGGCVAVSFRFESFTFEMETQLLYGGTTHAFDWTFPMSFLIPLGNERSLFEGGYLRFGGSPVGATFGREEDGGSFVRFGLFAGAGYEIVLSDVLSWRVIDARASFDIGTRAAMDRLGHGVDLGLQLGTGLTL